MSDKAISMEIKNDIDELETVQNGAARFCANIGLTRKDCFQIKVVVEEIFVNIVNYGYPDGGEHWINVSLAFEGGAVILGFEDDGIEFNPLEEEGPDVESPLNEREEGGLGLHLTCKMMNEMIYKRRKNKNCLILKKWISAG